MRRCRNSFLVFGKVSQAIIIHFLRIPVFIWEGGLLAFCNNLKICFIVTDHINISTQICNKTMDIDIHHT